MNTRTNKTVLLIILMICLATAVYSAVGTFTFRTSGASDTTEVVDLRYPQKVPEDASVTTDSIADGSITNDKLAEPVSVANGGTGKTTEAEALAALGGASLNGSSTVDFNTKKIYGSQSNQSAPTYSFSGNTDTGIYSNGPDTLGLAAGGVAGLVTSGGNTAIGAAALADSRLRIAGGTTTNTVTTIVEPPCKSMSVGSTNYIDALKIGLQNDSIPVGETDSGYRHGIYINNRMYSTDFKGTLASLFGLRVNTGILNGTGTLINCYGVYITNASGTGIITNNWGLYQETSAARNYFAGRTLVGTTTDDGVSALQVAGGGLRLVGGAAPSSPAEGNIYFNSTNKHFYGYNGTAWVQLDN